MKKFYQNTSELIGKAGQSTPAISRAQHVIQFTQRFRKLMPEHIANHITCCVPKAPETLLIYVDEPTWNMPVRMQAGAILANHTNAEWAVFRKIDVKTTTNSQKRKQVHTPATSATGASCVSGLANHTEHSALKSALLRLAKDLKKT